MCSLVRKCGFKSLPQLSSCVLWFLHTVDFCHKEPWSVHKYLGTNSTVGLFCYLSLHILKLWCEDIWLDLPTLCSFHLLVRPNTVLCIADLTHVQSGPARKGGRKRERRKGKRDRHRDCVSVLERKFFSVSLDFFFFLENQLSLLQQGCLPLCESAPWALQIPEIKTTFLPWLETIS